MSTFSTKDLLDAFQRGRGEYETLERMVTASRLMNDLHTRSRGMTRFNETFREAREKASQFFRDNGYLVFGDTLSINALKMSPNKEYIVALAHLSKQGENTLSFGTTGDIDEANTNIRWFSDNFPTTGSLISTAVGIKENGAVGYDKNLINPEKARMAKQEFYPWLSISLEDYYKAFMESNESILVMFGPAGTGKSTFLRSLILQSKIDAVMCYDRHMVESPAVLRSFFRHSASLLGYEDIDKHLKAREDGNTLMSSLLNAADGVVEHKKKIVFVTNLPNVDKIDEALLRSGRCFDILEFPHLTVEEAQLARAAAGLPLREFSADKKMALSDALAEDVPARQVINRFGRKAGFA